jgi:hypothetical protein
MCISNEANHYNNGLGKHVDPWKRRIEKLVWTLEFHKGPTTGFEAHESIPKNKIWFIRTYLILTLVLW